MATILLLCKTCSVILAYLLSLTFSNKPISKSYWLYFQKYIQNLVSSHDFFCFCPGLSHHHSHLDNYNSLLMALPIQSIRNLILCIKCWWLLISKVLMLHTLTWLLGLISCLPFPLLGLLTSGFFQEYEPGSCPKAFAVTALLTSFLLPPVCTTHRPMSSDLTQISPFREDFLTSRTIASSMNVSVTKWCPGGFLFLFFPGGKTKTRRTCKCGTACSKVLRISWWHQHSFRPSTDPV